MKNIIFLIGFMGAGKTEIGKILSKKLNYKFLDSDYEIEKYEKMTISEIFKTKGEEYFRNLETAFIKNFLKVDYGKNTIKGIKGNGENVDKIREYNSRSREGNYEDGDNGDIKDIKYIDINDSILLKINNISVNNMHYVIATGGGMSCFNDNINLLKDKGSVIYLKARPETIYERIKDEKHRPVLGQSGFSISEIKRLMEKREQFYDKADLIIYTEGISPEGIAEEIKIFLNNI